MSAAPNIRVFEEILDYGRKGRIAYVATIEIFKAAPKTWNWREIEFEDFPRLAPVIKHAIANGFAIVASSRLIPPHPEEPTEGRRLEG